MLTASLVGLGLAVAAVVSAGVEDLSRETDASLRQSATMVSRFDLNRLANGSFEDIEGMLAAGLGVTQADGSLPGGNTIEACISAFAQPMVTIGKAAMPAPAT